MIVSIRVNSRKLILNRVVHLVEGIVDDIQNRIRSTHDHVPVVTHPKPGEDVIMVGIMDVSGPIAIDYLKSLSEALAEAYCVFDANEVVSIVPLPTTDKEFDMLFDLLPGHLRELGYKGYVTQLMTNLTRSTSGRAKAINHRRVHQHLNWAS